MTESLSTKGPPVDLTQPLKVYWAPGCTSCLRTKEFLTKRGVPFISVNAFEDEKGFAELARFGIRRVPIVARGDQWADGQMLKDVARVAGISLDGSSLLPVDQLTRKGASVLSVALRLLDRIPEDSLGDKLPGRDRSYLQLGAHVFHIFDLFLDLAEKGRRIEFEDYDRSDYEGVESRESLRAYGERVRDRFVAWSSGCKDTSFTARADVYYGEQTLHEFLDRSVWHAAQHVRQVEEVVMKLGISIDGGLTVSDLAGLAIPENVYDDKMRIR